MNGNKDKTKTCDACRGELATVLCSECFKCYCYECNERVHDKDPMKGLHKTEAIPGGVKIEASCSLHKDEPLEMICIDEVKLCCPTCKTENSHKGHNVVSIQDNGANSAATVNAQFADVVKRSDELDEKITSAIEGIRREIDGAKKSVQETFDEARNKLDDEEAEVIDKLEKIYEESEELLQRNLCTLRDIRDYSTMLNEAYSEIHGEGKESSRLLDLNLVCEMKEQLRTVEELCKIMMPSVKIEWDGHAKELSYTKCLFNGGPIPNSISFPAILSRKIDISWDCNLDEINNEDRKKIKYVVEVKKGNDDEERGWNEVYSGTDKKCSASGLEKGTDYDVRVKCVIGDLQGEWSGIAKTKTKEISIFSECVWKECPESVDPNRKYALPDEKNGRIARKIGSRDWCTIAGNIPLPLNKTTSWGIKILKSKEDDGGFIYIGVAPSSIDQNERENSKKCGWYFDCYYSKLRSGPPQNSLDVIYGPRQKRKGEYVRSRDTVGVAMNTADGKLSFSVNGADLGVAYVGIPLDKPLMPCVLLYQHGDSVELVI